MPAYLGVVAVLAALTGLVAWSAHRLSRDRALPIWIALPVAWTAGEWLRAHLPGGLAFPWLGLGTSLTGFPELAGVAEIVGARGVTFWLALCGSLAGTALLRWREGRRWGPAAAAFALAVALPAGWSLWRARTLELRPAGRVAVVQPGSDRPAGVDGGFAAARTLAAAGDLLPRIRDGAPDLVVWPETALPVPIGEPAWAGTAGRVEGWSREAGAPVLFGAYGGAAGGRRTNSAFAVEPGRGLGDFRYDKRHLVPVIEAAPPGGGLPALGRDSGGGLAPGRGPLRPARVGGLRLGVLICYESSFPGLARRYRGEGAEILVNLTNDAWFGGEEPWARTGGLWQHPAHLVMRAIENRMGVVRAASTGFSFFVDPVGRIHDRTGLFEPAAPVATVRTTGVRTVYVALGDVVGQGSAALTLLLLASAAVRRRRG